MACRFVIVIMCSLFSWMSPAFAGSERIESSFMALDVPSNDQTVVGDIKFDRSVRSLTECARECAEDPGADCQSFTFTPASTLMTSPPASCRGYSSLATSHGTGSVSSPGSRTYYTLPEDEDWLRKPCSQDADCSKFNVANTRCFQGLCLCTPGYYFSHSKKLCLDRCSQLSEPAQYITYNGSGLFDNNLKSSNGRDAQACQDWCTATSGCVTADHKASDAFCALATVTPLDDPAKWFEDDPAWEFFHRTCA